MKWKAWLLLLVLMPAINAFAAAQVEERELKGNAVETAQRKADFARKRAMDAEQQVQAAEREVAEAERADQEARQRAAAADRRLEEARAGLSRAQSNHAAARASAGRAAEEVNKESTHRDRTQ